MIGAGAAYEIAGPVTLVIDASHGLTSSSPRWVFSLGLGTAFASTSLVSPTSPLQRQQTSFASGVNRGAGSGKTGGCPRPRVARRASRGPLYAHGPPRPHAPAHPPPPFRRRPRATPGNLPPQRPGPHPPPPRGLT